MQLNRQASDGWILDGSGLTTLAFQPEPVLMDLSAWAGANAALEISDYAPFWRDNGPTFGGNLLSLPMQGRNLLLFYRCCMVLQVSSMFEIGLRLSFSLETSPDQC